MKRDLIEILCCPICKGDLTVNIMEENEKDIMQGIFRCESCNLNYPIEDGIPNMLPPNMR